MKRSTLPLQKIISGFLLAIVLVSTIWTKVSAQESQTLVAIPPRRGENRELTAKPGETIQTNIRLKNNSKKNLTIKSFAQDFVVDDNGRTPIPVGQEVSNRWSLASWMVVAPNQHDLAPGETAQMNVVIEIPKDALPGGHYAMVLHEPTNEDLDQVAPGQQAATGVTQKIGTLFYVVVDGPINEEAYIRDFKFKKFQEFGPVPFSFTVSNQSDIHIKPRMKIDLFNLIGQKVESIQVEPRNVFPLNNLDFKGKWDRIWGFGLYKAKLSMSYGQNGQLALATTNFWILPIRIILAIIFTLLLIVALAGAVRRHIKHKTEQEAEKVKQLQQKLDQYEGNAQTDQTSQQADPTDRE